MEVSRDDEAPHQILDVSYPADEPPPPRSHSYLLSFSNLTYTVKVRKGQSGDSDSTRPLIGGESNFFTDRKVLLNNISGEARDGELLAVLGASGSGKSTLIDALASRISKDSLKGRVTLNHELLDPNMLKVISAYVMQDDLLYPMLTVEETLMFAAEFRLPRALSREKKKMRVQALMDQLGLQNAAGTVIGDEGHRGVSGGERRRVSIGMDIIHDPIILFLDEPTSGLDSTSAFLVIKVLQNIALTGSIVIMTIHQPSNRILQLLDRLLILSRGQTVFGSPPASLPRFFAEFGHPIPDGENRIEFALDLIRELEGRPEGTRWLVDFNDKWQKEAKSKEVPTAVPPLTEAISASVSRGKLVSGSASDTSPADPVSMVPVYANPIWKEIAVLTNRSVINTLRMPEVFLTRFVTVSLTGIILATLFWDLDDTPKGVQERLGFFAYMMSTTFYTTGDALPVFIQERFIFIRETAYNAYRRLSYVVSNTLVNIPGLVIVSFAFAAITFWAVGLNGGASGFFFYFGIIFASFWAGHSFVTFISAIVTNIIVGFIIVIAVLAYMVLYSGFFVNRKRIPRALRWVHYISVVKYPYEAVLRNEFGDPNKCFTTGIQMFDNSALIAGVSEPVKEQLLSVIGDALQTNITRSTCVTTGADVLVQQGVTELNKWKCFWITVACGFFFRILFYIALYLGSRNKRK